MSRLQIVILTTLLGTGTVLYTGSQYTQHTAAELERQAEERLKAMGTSKKDAVESWYTAILSQMATQAQDEGIAQALLTFSAARKNLLADLEKNGLKLDEGMVKEMKTDLARFYKTVLIQNLSEVRKQSPGTPESYMHPDTEATVLQYVYTSANPAPVGNKYLLNLPNDVAQNSRLDDIDKNLRSAFSKTEYAKAIGMFHPLLDRIRERFGYYDIFLVDTDGFVVYTNFKELDFQGNLIHGPEQKTGLSVAYDKAMKAEYNPHEDTYLALTPLEPYPKSYDAPASFLASAIWKDGKKIGALIYQLPIDRINGIMTSSGLYANAGLGATGESYLVSAVSGKLVQQTDSRFVALLPSNQRRPTISADGKIPGFTTIGVNEVQSRAADHALKGSGEKLTTYTNYRGKEVLGYATSFKLADAPHAIVVEIEKSEVLGPAEYQKKLSKIFGSSAFGLFLIVSLYLGSLVMKPARIMTACTKDLKSNPSLGASSSTPKEEEVGVVS